MAITKPIPDIETVVKVLTNALAQLEIPTEGVYITTEYNPDKGYFDIKLESSHVVSKHMKAPTSGKYFSDDNYTQNNTADNLTWVK